MSGSSRIARATVDADRDGGGAIVGPPWKAVGANDFNHDRATDLVWHNDATGETQVWFMSGSSRIGRATVVDTNGVAMLVGSPWSIVGTNDFDRDGSTDLLWHNDSTGETQLWYMHGLAVVARATVDANQDGGAAFVGAPWSIVATGDFNLDGNADILWHNASTGESQVWFMRDSSRIGRASLALAGSTAFVGSPWSVVGAQDFNGDGERDVVWHNEATGETQLWFLQGTSVVRRARVTAVDGGGALVGPPWQIIHQ
jgi:hypothetical protein